MVFSMGYFALLPLMHNAAETISNTSITTASSSPQVLVMPEYTSLEEDLSVALLPDPTFPSHALMRHGAAALTAGICNASNYTHKFYNKDTERTAYVCLVENKFGVHIFEKTKEEVTAFIKDRMKRVEQIINYMKNAGYDLVEVIEAIH